MPILLVIIHVTVCIALIMTVLLQTGKGADMGAAFGGGGSNTLFGSTGASTFLSKATTVVAIVFMLTSLTLAYTSMNRSRGSVMTEMTDVQKGDVKKDDAGAQTVPPSETSSEKSDNSAD
jgi:preprotein translocase subunit SecG